MVVSSAGHASAIVVCLPVGEPVGQHKIEHLPTARLRGTSQAEARRGARSDRKRGDGKSEQTGKTQGPEGHRGRVNVGAGMVHVKGPGSEKSSIHGKILRSNGRGAAPRWTEGTPGRGRPARPWPPLHLRVFQAIAEFCGSCRWPSPELARTLSGLVVFHLSLPADPAPFLTPDPLLTHPPPALSN